MTCNFLSSTCLFEPEYTDNELREMSSEHYTSECGSCVSITSHASWYSREGTSKTDMEEKKLLNKVDIFVFFVHKCILIASKIKVEPLMSHGLFNDVLNLSGPWIIVPLLSMQGQIALRFHQKYLNLCDERRTNPLNSEGMHLSGLAVKNKTNK